VLTREASYRGEVALHHTAGPHLPGHAAHDGRGGFRQTGDGLTQAPPPGAFALRAACRQSVSAPARGLGWHSVAAESFTPLSHSMIFA
jgi:hypothetical protein